MEAGSKPPLPPPTSDKACRDRLAALGAVFEPKPPQTAPGGCSVPDPVLVSSLSPTITLEPAALLDCPMAETAARFARDVAAPAGRWIFGRELAAIGQASAYVCRPRHGTAKLSEHAFGNALDIARFLFKDGASVEVGPVPSTTGDRFLAEIRKAACGPFKTVLGPGSDADHATHLHLDLARRRHGGTFCQ